MKKHVIKFLTVIAFCSVLTAAGLFISTPAKAAAATAEWAAGNASVNATFGYDIANSADPAEKWWSFTQYDSNMNVSYNNQAYKDEGMWWKNSYVGLKPLMYTTVADAVNPTINLGYYEGDFKMTSTPVQSVYPNPSSGWDYTGLLYTFKNTASSDYFTVLVKSAYGLATTVEVSFNGGEPTSSNIAFDFQRRNNGTWNSSGGVLYPLVIKYDVENNVIKTNRNLSTVISLENLGLTTAFETYSVDMRFYNVAAGHTAKLCVYSLNGYDLTAEPDNDLTSTGTVVYRKLSAYLAPSDAVASVSDLAGAWDAAEGDVGGELEFTVLNPDGDNVALSDGKFTAEEGTYTITATKENISKTFDVNITIAAPVNAEWATGNDSVSATFGYDIANSENPAEQWWSMKQYDSNMNVQYNNSALQAEGMWTKNSYVGLKPLLYESAENTLHVANSSGKINLGYYEGDFKMTATPVQSVYPNMASGWDYNGLIFTFKDTASENYFTVRFTSIYNGSKSYDKVFVSYNGGAETEGDSIACAFLRRTNGTWGGSGGALYLLSLKYDVADNAIKTNRDLSTSVSLSALGLITAFNTYTVDMRFYNVQAGHTAKLCVYSLNGYDLTSVSEKGALNSNGTVIYPKNTTYQTGSDSVILDVSNLAGAWDTAAGEVDELISYTISDADGHSVDISDGKFSAEIGEYTVKAMFGSASKTFKVIVEPVPDIPSTEWATGNANVSATFAYDITNSPYSWWAMTNYDSNTNRGYNSYLQAEGMWTKNSYVGLKPLFYESVKNSADPSINLGYYGGDFKMTATPVQSVSNNPQSGWDYSGLIFKFTDIVSSDYFTITVRSVYGFNPTIVVASSSGVSVSSNISFDFYRRTSGTWGKSDGLLDLLSLKYDKTENAIKTNRRMMTTIPLSKIGINKAFESYKVDMKFYNVAEDRTAKLCVYSLNGYDLTENLTNQEVAPQILLKGGFITESFITFDFNVPQASAWDAHDGNLPDSSVETHVFAPDGNEITPENGKVIFSQSGVYRFNYKAVSETKSLTAEKTFEINVLGKIPVAEITMGGEIPSECGVGGTLQLPKAEFLFMQEISDGYIVIRKDSKIVASFDDVNDYNSFTFTEKGEYAVSYVYTSAYGFSNAKTCKINCVEKLAIGDTELPERIGFSSGGYVVKECMAVLGEKIYPTTVGIVSPSGESITLPEDRLFVPEEMGTYVFNYSAAAEGQTATAKWFVDVYYKPSDLLVPNTNVSELIENVDAKYVKDEGLNGVAVVSNAGGEVRFANVVDLSAIGKETPIVQFQALTESDGYSYINTVIVKLTDIYDESNVVKIKWYVNTDSKIYTYLSVNAGGNGYYGVRSGDGYVFKNKYGTNCSGSMRTDIYPDRCAFNICMDYAENAFYYYNLGIGNVLVIDADDVNQVGDYQWKGFTTGEVYVSVSLPDAPNGGVIITSIAGQKLSGKTVSDTCGPDIIINTEKEYVAGGMPDGVVGTRYPIPSVNANDLVAGRVSSVVSVKYYNEESDAFEDVAVSDNSFMPEKAGSYKIIWAAEDACGNIGTRTIDVSVVETATPMVAAFKESVGDIYVGDKIYVPEITATGGNGKVVINTEWTLNGEKTDFAAPNFFIATQVGTFKATVVMRDYLGNETTQELSINISAGDPVITVFGVPTSALKGSLLNLPDFTAYDFRYGISEQGFNAQRKILVNGEEISLTERSYTVSQNAGETLTVRYVAISIDGSRESAKEFTVNVLDPTYINDYLIYNKQKVSVNLNATYTEFSASQDFTVLLPNPVSAGEMKLIFYPDSELLKDGGKVSVILTDADDSTVVIKLTVVMNADKYYLYVNDNIGEMMALTVSQDGKADIIVNAMKLQITDNTGRKIIGLEKDYNGYDFSGFNSGAAKVVFEVSGVNSATSLRINQVGNQKFVTEYSGGTAKEFKDRTGAELTFEFAMNSGSAKKGETVYVSAVKAFDVLQNNATVTVSVRNPDGTWIINDADISKTLSFVANAYGPYDIIYTVKSGNITDKNTYSYRIKVRDEEPPVITVSGDISATCNVGDTLTLPSATATDNKSKTLTLYVFVIEPSGKYVNVSSSLTYKVEKEGKYKVVYYVVDDDYNVARNEFTIVAKGVEK